MYKRKKLTITKIFVFVVSTILIISGFLKICFLRPLVEHVLLMGLNPVLIKLLGMAEITFSILFLLDPTRKIGLLLLTGYFGGAIAAEIPFHQVAGPMVPLVLVWLAAFFRQPADFLPGFTAKNKSNLSTINS